MKASEMTNEELAKELMSRVPLDSSRHDDIREAAATVAQEMLNTSMQEITADRINGWATRLAAACEQTVTDCNQLGNAAKLREALERLHERALMDLYENAFVADTSRNYKEFIKRTIKIAESVLSAPPRNCDRFATFDDARNTFFADYMLDETRSSASAFAIWIFDKAKGDME